MRPGRLPLPLTLFVLSIHAIAQAQQPVPTSTYTDPAQGVSFRYPAVWQLSKTGQFYDSVPIVPPETQETQAVVNFKAANTPYANTNLSGLDFTYTVVPQPSSSDCDALAIKSTGGPGKSDHLNLNGVSFLHLKSGSASMCNQLTADLYTTFRNGRCFVFQAGFHTICAGVVDGSRALTPAETRALSRHLDAIMPTVRFSTSARPPSPH